MAFTKKQVHFALIGAGVLIGGIVLYKLMSGTKTAATATAVKNQQLNQSAGAVQAPATPPLLAPLLPVGLANADPNDSNTLTPISAGSAPALASTLV